MIKICFHSAHLSENLFVVGGGRKSGHKVEGKEFKEKSGCQRRLFKRTYIGSRRRVLKRERWAIRKKKEKGGQSVLNVNGSKELTTALVDINGEGKIQYAQRVYQFDLILQTD